MSKARPAVITALRGALIRGQRVVLAVSGGADSMALMHGVSELRVELGLGVIIGHVDHGIRPDSRKDADFVRNAASKLELDCIVRRVGPAPQSNIEAWARRRRYEALQEILARSSSNLILTAHTADDVAETLLMRLLANKEPTSIDGFDPTRCLLRPFLGVSRGAVIAYLKERGVDWSEDPSNQSMRFTRNRVRHKVIPILKEQFGESVIQVLADSAARLHRDLHLLRALGQEQASRLAALKFGSREWLKGLLALLADLPEPIKLRVVEAIFSPTLPFKPGRGSSKRILEFLESGRLGLELSSGLALRRSSGGIQIVRSKR